MPLWIAIPVVAVLWLWSWISGMDITADRGEAYVIWGVTAIASTLLMLRLVRAS